MELRVILGCNRVMKVIWLRLNVAFISIIYGLYAEVWLSENRNSCEYGSGGAQDYIYDGYEGGQLRIKTY